MARPNIMLPSYPIYTHRRKGLQELIDLGRYDNAHREISAEHFTINNDYRSKTAKVFLLRPNEIVTGTDVFVIINKAGYKPAGLLELLAFGAQHPHMQEELLILEVGTVWRKPRLGRSSTNLIVCLGSCFSLEKSGRTLIIEDLDNTWTDHYGILVTLQR